MSIICKTIISRSMIKNLPKLPRGLEYEIITRDGEMCGNCMGIIQKGPTGVMIRKSQRRKMDYYGNYFPEVEGLCLKCSVKQLARMVAECYNSTEANIEAASRFEATGDEESAKIANAQVDGLHETIQNLSKYMGVALDVDQTYITEGTHDFAQERWAAEAEADDED